MIAGIGVDIVDIARFETTLERTPGLRDRLFTAIERDLPLQSLAATFAAKEAVSKAVGAPAELVWHDVEVSRAESGRPSLRVSREPWSQLSWHLSISHDGGVAVAMVVAEQ